MTKLRRCLYCRALLVARSHERPVSFAKRHWCNLRCRYSYCNALREKKADCAACGTPLVRRDGEPPVVFNRRQTCGRGACLTTFQAALAATRRTACEPDRRCNVCDKPLAKKPREWWAHFAKRKTCGIGCSLKSAQHARKQLVAAARNALEALSRACAYCKSPLRLRDNERKQGFLRRTHCNGVCAAKDRRLVDFIGDSKLQNNGRKQQYRQLPEVKERLRTRRNRAAVRERERQRHKNDRRDPVRGEQMRAYAREYMRQWRAEDPDRFRNYSSAYRERKRNRITDAQWTAIAAAAAKTAKINLKQKRKFK